jgi:hypothetical protein
MKITIDHNILDLTKAMLAAPSQIGFALKQAVNNSATKAREDVREQMRTKFNRPTNYFLNSLRVKYATSKEAPIAEVWFKDKNSVESADSMVGPHIFGGERRFKPMETRLQRAGLLPSGWQVVPGAGAKLDAFGNMSRGEISLILNVLGTYKESGYNKANDKTKARLAKGNIKKNVYGFELWVNPVGGTKGKHLPPGVYKRVTTGFGSSLKPMLIFVKSTNYRKRLDFYAIVNQSVNQNLQPEFDAAFLKAVNTAILKQQGTLF